MAENFEEALESLEEAVLGVNEVKSQLEQIKNIRSQFEVTIQETNRKISAVNDQAEDISFIHEDIKKIKEEMDKHSSEVLTQLNDSISSTKYDFSSIKNQIQQLQVKINAIENDVKNKHGIQPYAIDPTEELKQLREENKRLKDENATLRMKTDKLEEENQSLKNEKSNLKKKFEDTSLELNNKIKILEIKLENGSHKISTIQNNPKNNVVLKKNREEKLSKFFISKGCEVIDRRPMDGSLWVVGDESTLKPILDEMKEKFGNISGSFGTGKAIQQRKGWYTKELIF